MTNKKIAIFDLDNTILEMDSDYEMVNYLIDNKYLENKFRKINKDYFNSYENGSLNIDEFSKFSLKPFIGMNMLDIKNILDNFYDQILSSKFNYRMLGIIDNHKLKGDLILLASATNSLIVSYVAKKLSIKNFISSEVLFQNNLCTGKVRKPYAFGSGKLKLVKYFMNKNNFNFKDAYFYSDSINDEPLLSKVRHPIAVNPDLFLEKKCLIMNWKILKT